MCCRKAEKRGPAMTLIRVPKPPAEAQNKDRRLSELLKAQLQHFRHVEERYFANIKTEGEAANYIRHVTSLLHPEGVAAEGKRDPVKASLLQTTAVAPGKPEAAVVVIDRIAARAESVTVEPTRKLQPGPAKTKSMSSSARKKSAKRRR